MGEKKKREKERKPIDRKKRRKKKLELTFYCEFLRGKIKNIPLWVIPLVIAILFFPLKGVITSPDSAWYVGNALNIYKGYGYIDADWTPVLIRGPVFPDLIAASFWLFGVSVEHAFWVVRLFFVLNALLIYFVGRKFYGKWIGLTSSLLVLTSFAVNRLSSYLLLDIIMPFFILLSILLIYLALEKKRYLWFILAGVALGIAYLTKEMSIIFFPLPILAFIFIRDFRNRRNLIGISILIAVLLAVIIPWAVHVYNTSSDLSWLLGGGSDVVSRLASPEGVAQGFNLFSAAKKYVGWLLNYYEYLAQNSFLAPLFALAWVFTFIRGILKREKPDLILLLSILLFSPIILSLGKKELRAGQSMILCLLSYIIVANFLFVAGRYIFTKASRLFQRKVLTQCILRYGIVSLVCLLMAVQIFGERKMLKLWTGMSVHGMSYYVAGGWLVGGWHNQLVETTGEWINKNIPKGSKLMSDWYWRDSIYFYAEGDYQISYLPYLVFPKHLAPAKQPGISSIRVEKPLFLWSYRNESRVDGHLRVLREGDLLSQIREKNIDFVIVTYCRNFLSLYFEANPAFKKIKDFGQGEIKIFQVKEVKPLKGFETRIGSATPDFLYNLEKERPEEFALLKREFFMGQLGLLEEEIDKIKDGGYPSVTLWTVY